MTRTDFFNAIVPSDFSDVLTENNSSLQVFKNKTKDIKYIKRITREKINLHGAPIRYYPLDLNTQEQHILGVDNITNDFDHMDFKPPINIVGTWTPQEYQMELSKFGIIMPEGSDQQVYIHVDEIEDKLKRKPVIGDILETLNDTIRYRVSDVYFGHGNLWENIFVMLTLSKATRNNNTEQLDKYDESYKDTYTKLEETLDLMSGEETHSSNAELENARKETTSIIDKNSTLFNTSVPDKRSIDTSLDIMTMTL